VRLLIAAVLGWMTVAWFGFGEPALFVMVAVGAVAFGGLVALATRLQPWSGK
jgi:hypothetical protein